MKNHSHEITASIDGGDLGDLDVTVTFTYERGEKPVYYPPDSAHPGVPESVEIEKVWCDTLEIDITNQLDKAALDDLENRCLDSMEDD